MWQVADAVRFIHSRQILHGDIKTENIFMVRTPAQRRLVKLLDFGLSRADLGRTEGVDGTPEYLAPERIDGAPASQASDIYALGIVFFELLTGKLPFVGDIEGGVPPASAASRCPRRRSIDRASRSTSAPTRSSRARPRRIRPIATPTSPRSCTSCAR